MPTLFIEAWFNINVFNILIATFLDDNVFNGNIVNSSTFVYWIYQALIPNINANHKYQQQIQSTSTILKYHIREKIYSCIECCRRRKNICRKYYGEENMMKKQKRVKATCRFKVKCLKVSDRGLLCCSLRTDARVISRGENKKLKRLIG